MATFNQKRIAKYLPKPCRECRSVFQPAGPSSHYCEDCRTLACLECGKTEIRPTVQNNDTFNFCSRLCANRWSMRRIWKRAEYREKMIKVAKENAIRNLVPLLKNEQTHPNWKGDKVGYDGLHAWVEKHKGKPGRCTKCGTEKGRMEWANVSGKYKRLLSDFVRLCVPCHREMDALKRKTTLINA